MTIETPIRVKNYGTVELNKSSLSKAMILWLGIVFGLRIFLTILAVASSLMIITIPLFMMTPSEDDPYLDYVLALMGLLFPGVLWFDLLILGIARLTKILSFHQEKEIEYTGEWRVLRWFNIIYI